MSEDTAPLHPAWGSGAARSHSAAAASHGRSGPALPIFLGRGPVCDLKWDGGGLRRGGPPRARCGEPPAPFARPLRAHNLRLPCGHGVLSDDPRREESVLQVLQETPRKVPVGFGVLLRGTLQGAVHDAEGGQEVASRARGRGGQLPSALVSYRCTRAAALWGARRSCSSRWLRSFHRKSPSRSLCWKNSSTEVPPGGS